jgi:hypothetical protein
MPVEEGPRSTLKETISQRFVAWQNALQRAEAVPIGPPTTATHFTRIRSGIENSTPIETIGNTTPSSANISKECKLDSLALG